MTTTSTNINIEANNMLPIDMSMAKRPLLSSGSTSSSSSSISRPPLLGDVELSVERCSDDLDESSSSSGSNSPNGKPLMVCEGERVIGYLNCNYLLKQMNKRKLHLPCPLCNSLVVNMSDHLAKTHMIVDFKQRKVLLNMVRQNHIMNPNELKHLLENNQYLLSKIRNPSQSTSSPSSSSSTSASQSVTVNRQQQQQTKPAPKPETAQSHLAGLEKKLDEFIKMASMGNLTLPSTTTTSNASPTAAAVTLASLHSLLQPAKNIANSNQPSAAVLTPDQSDIERFSEESESNNTKAESSPESSSSSETTTVLKHDTIGDELCSPSSMQSLDDSSTTTIQNNNNNSNNASYLSRMKQLKNKRKSARPAPYTNENKENRRSNLPPAHLKALLQPSAILGASQALNILPQQPQQSSQIAASTTSSLDGEKRIGELETRLNHTIKSFNVFQSGVIKQIELFFKDFQKTVEELQNVKNSMLIDNNHHRPNQLF